MMYVESKTASMASTYERCEVRVALDATRTKRVAEMTMLSSGTR